MLSAEKSFYEENNLEDICDWLEDYINAATCSGCTLTEVIGKYGERAKEVDATLIGGLQKLIDFFQSG